MFKSDSEPLISIIIPVYNAAEYLEECVDSIIAQTVTGWELLLIDDGSDDGSGSVCDSFASNDERIICIHQENKGPSAARNAGLDRARGKYIAMVDADDVLLDKRYLELLLEAVTEADADISFCKLKGFQGKPPLIAVETDRPECVVTTGPEFCSRKFHEYNNFFGCPIAKLIRAGLFDHLRFPEDIVFSEDNAIAHRLYFPCRKIVLLDRQMYGNRNGINSQSGRTDLGRKIDDLNKTFSDRIAYYSSQGRDDLAALSEKEKYYHIAQGIGIALHETPSHESVSRIWSNEEIIGSMDSFHGRAALKTLYAKAESFRDSALFGIFKKQELRRTLSLFSMISDTTRGSKRIVDSPEEVTALFPMAYDQNVFLRLLRSLRDHKSIPELDEQWTERRDYLISRSFRMNRESDAVVALARQLSLPLFPLCDHAFSPQDHYTLPEDNARYFLADTSHPDKLAAHLESRGFASSTSGPFKIWESKDVGQIVLLDESEFVTNDNTGFDTNDRKLRTALYALLADHGRLCFSHLMDIYRISEEDTGAADSLLPYSSLAHKLMSGCAEEDLNDSEKSALIRMILS